MCAIDGKSWHQHQDAALHKITMALIVAMLSLQIRIIIESNFSPLMHIGTLALDINSRDDLNEMVCALLSSSNDEVHKEKGTLYSEIYCIETTCTYSTATRL